MYVGVGVDPGVGGGYCLYLFEGRYPLPHYRLSVLGVTTPHLCMIALYISGV